MARKELVLVTEHTAGATPSRVGMQQSLAQQWSVKPEQVDIKQIVTNAGKHSSRVRVHVWQEAKVADLSKAKEEKPAETATAEAEKK